MESNPGKTPSETLKLRILVKSEQISPKLANSISLTPGWSGLERGITQGKFCAPHRTLVIILCKQSENFVEGAVINYKVNLSLSMRLQIVANHLLSPYYAIWFQCSFHFYMIHLCYMYRVIIGGNLVRLNKESGMKEIRLISLRLPSAIPDTIPLPVKNTGIRKLIRVRVIFIICLKLIMVDII